MEATRTSDSRYLGSDWKEAISKRALRHYPHVEWETDPAGTKIDLTLNRDGKTFKAATILWDIVAP